MIGERTRNVIVGLTIILALAVCVYGINLLGKIPRNLHQYKLTLIAPDANGVTSGARVLFNGLDIGLVQSVYSAVMPPDDSLVIKLELSLDSNIHIPESAMAMLTRPQAVGNPYVEIRAQYARPPMIRQDGSATLQANSSDSGIIPEKVFKDIHDLKADLASAAHELTTVLQDLHLLLRYAPPDAVDKADPNDPNRLVSNASTVVVRLDNTIKNLGTWLNDPKLQGNVREAIQNIADASKQLQGTLQKIDTAAGNANKAIDGFTAAAGSLGGAANKASDTLESIQKDFNKITQNLAETLGQIEKSVKDLTEGNGTTGKLVNDPRLYDGLLDLSNTLKKTVSDLDFLVQKWKDEGVRLNLK